MRALALVVNFLSVLAVLAVLVLGLDFAFAQERAYSFRGADVTIDVAELRGSDAEAELTVHAHVDAADGGGLTLSRSRRCSAASMTAAQRTALATMRAAALSCWRTGEGL